MPVLRRLTPQFFYHRRLPALRVFPDCVIRAAFSKGLPRLDLPLTCTEERDDANPIEPSVTGGEKSRGGDHKIRYGT